MPGSSLGSGFSLIDGALRWTSRENLLTAANDEDPQLFVALYDFQAGGENQLSLKKAEQVRIPFSVLMQAGYSAPNENTKIIKMSAEMLTC